MTALSTLGVLLEIRAPGVGWIGFSGGGDGLLRFGGYDHLKLKFNFTRGYLRHGFRPFELIC